MERRFARLGPSATVVLAGLGVPCVASADLNDLLPLLQNPIEIAAARANQSVYDALTTPQGPGQGPRCDPMLSADPGTGSCTGNAFLVFSEVRELVHTANELTGGGPTGFSLGLDRESLGFALRWTAAEELAAQGSAATRFSGSQLNSLASRISALRFGARGFSVVDADISSEERFASLGGSSLGGGASADADDLVKKWGGFIDGSFGYGRQDDTTNLPTPGSEDAFDYDGLDVTVGLDYRFGQRIVVGAILGHTKRRIDFDSSQSIVDGSIESDGQSLLLYTLWESGDVYVSASFGMQSLGHDLVRRIVYPSLNPLVPSTDETALSSTDSQSLLGSFGIGYAWRRGGFTVEPYLRGEYQDIDIDGFSERNAEGFDFTFGDQSITSFDASAGLKLQQVFTPSFGIVIPFLRAEIHRDLSDDVRSIDAVYSGIVDITGLESPQNFNVATNDADDQYYIGTFGFSLVLKHGLQGFLQYQQTFELEHIDDRAIAGGVRFEF
jgi:outer membrane autotransporter protein